MSVHELPLPGLNAVNDEALALLERWARERPERIALRHRRLGTWRAWRWIDVLREVERYAAGLDEQGFAPRDRLAVSGAFEPTLLILALAARRLGGQVVSVPRHASGEALRRVLAGSRPAFAFVQARESVSDWLQLGPQADWTLTLFSAQAVPREAGRWQVRALGELLPGPAPAVQHRSSARPAGEALLWNDEGTEWEAGLAHLLGLWLARGDALAFPETSASALRDRREAAPSELLASPERLQALAAEIEARLPPVGSWRRRLCDWTLRDPARGLRRLIKAQVRQLLGFQRLQRIHSPREQQREGLGWIREYLERAA